MADEYYFSDRVIGPKPRASEEISQAAWGGIAAAINSRISDASFGYGFPLQCPDGAGVYACDETAFSDALAAEIHDISLPLRSYETPPTLAVLDLIEFCHRRTAKPIQGAYHPFFKHHHLSFDVEKGQESFRQDINRIFSRNGLAYALEENGRIVRLAPEVLRQSLSSEVFRTGDDELDSLLESARKKFLDPDPDVRRESLEKLWDAWERIKTIEPGKDKRASVNALLEKVASDTNFRKRLEDEARELTAIGNAFQIRHSEVNQIPLHQTEHIDYLFHRLFSLIQLILRTTNRGG